jgi:putative nucleotidyltransferase with HDIG domain
MRLLLNILLAVLTLAACYAEDLYLFVRPPHPGVTLPITVRVKHPFEFDQQKALDESRQMALAQYVPLFRHVPENVEDARNAMVRLVMKVYSLQTMGKSAVPKLVSYLKEAFNLDLDSRLAAKILRYNDLIKLLNGVSTIQEALMQRNILDSTAALRGKSAIEVIYAEPAGRITVSADELIGLESARLLLQEKANSLFWQVDKQILDAILQVVLTTLAPTVTYDQEENQKRIDSIISQFPARKLHFKQGQVLLPVGAKLNREVLLLIQAYRNANHSDIYQTAFWNFLVVILVITLFNLFFHHFLPKNRRSGIHCRLLLACLAAVVVFFKVILLITPFPVYVLPFSLLPLLLVLLNHQRVLIVWITVVGAMLVTLFTGNSFEIFLFFAFGGISAVLLSGRVQKRSHILVPSMSVGLINALVLTAMFINPPGIFRLVQARGAAALVDAIRSPGLFPADLASMAFIGGLAAGPLALLFVPLLEIWSRSASTFQLNRFVDLQHPLLRELLEKCPGTYQHTMTVAYLAHTVGEAVGANALLLRVGAYYHDLGKFMNPNFFVENQFSGKNSHDDLAPEESSDIIINHVREGRMIGESAGLPEAVLDLIDQHHGSQLVEYFYDKAVKASPHQKPPEAAFRYPGPKPQTVEAAILMVVDTVEAASRTIEEPTPPKIDELIQRLLDKKLHDGQFDECNLTTAELAVIRQKLAEALVASLHSRVKYPWQERSETPPEPIAGPSAQPKTIKYRRL